MFFFFIVTVCCTATFLPLPSIKAVNKRRPFDKIKIFLLTTGTVIPPNLNLLLYDPKI